MVKMKRRLALSILSTLFEEAAIAAAVLWGLPLLGVHIPLWGLLVIMAVWAGYSAFTHRLGSRALNQEHVIGLQHMLGTTGEAVSALAPEGMVRIKGELWIAQAAEGEIKPGRRVVVVGQERLKLIVSESE